MPMLSVSFFIAVWHVVGFPTEETAFNCKADVEMYQRVILHFRGWKGTNNPSPKRKLVLRNAV